MSLPASDSFTGTNGTALQTYSASWTIQCGAFDIQSNAVAPNSLGNEIAAFWNADSFDAAQYSQGVVTMTTESGGATGVCARCSTGTTDSYYMYYSDGSTSSGRYLGKMVSGTWTQLGNSTTPFSNGATVRLETSGTTITPRINGTTDSVIGARTDSSLSSGAAGLAGYGDVTTLRIDDWQGGNLTGSHSLTATGLAAGSPLLGSPALGQAHGLTAVGLAAGQAVVPALNLGQAHSLSAGGLASGQPAVGSPALGQAGVMEATPLAAGSPVLGSPALAVVAALAAVGLAAGRPLLGSPGWGGVMPWARRLLVDGEGRLCVVDGEGREHVVKFEDRIERI